MIVNAHILDFVICMERLGYIYNMLFVPIFRDFSATLEMTANKDEVPQRCSG